MRPIWWRWVECHCLSVTHGGCVQMEKQGRTREMPGDGNWWLARFSGRFRGCLLCLLPGWWCMALCGWGGGVTGRKARTPLALSSAPVLVKPWGAASWGTVTQHTPPHSCRDCSPIRQAQHLTQSVAVSSEKGAYVTVDGIGRGKVGPATTKRKSSWCGP